jgi:hypothetical protein
MVVDDLSMLILSFINPCYPVSNTLLMTFYILSSEFLPSTPAVSVP